MFTGEYRHSVDDKGRLAVPSQFRAQLDAGPSSRAGSTHCLAIHTRAGWDALADKVATLPITDERARRFQRFIFAGAVETTLDGQGRVLIPAYLRDMAGLDAEAVVVGSRDHAEIWAPDPLGRRTAGASRIRQRSPRPSPGSASERRSAARRTADHMRFQGPLGIRRSMVEER